MIRFSVILSYYCNPDELKRQLVLWSHLNAKWLNQTEFIVVDDGSPTAPLTPTLLTSLVDGLNPIHIRAYRLTKDVGFNNLGARNLGAFVALGSHLIFIDMDSLILPGGGMADALFGEVAALSSRQPYILYFSRYVLKGKNGGDGNMPVAAIRDAMKRTKHLAVSTSPNSFAMLRSQFWSVGGFNEDLSGTYGTDYEFKSRTARYGYKRMYSGRGRIVALCYGPRRKPHPKRPLGGFPSNPLRLPWVHLWSSPSYLDIVKEQPLTIRVVSPHSLLPSPTFPRLDVPAFPCTKSLVPTHSSSLFGIDKPVNQLPDKPRRKGESPHFRVVRESRKSRKSMTSSLMKRLY